MLNVVFRVLVNNSLKIFFIKKEKKVINILIIFSISFKSDIKFFFFKIHSSVVRILVSMIHNNI